MDKFLNRQNTGAGSVNAYSAADAPHSTLDAPRANGPALPDKFSLAENEIHVWTIQLEAPAASMARFASILSLDERARGARFHFDHHRSRFIVGRGVLRLILSRYLQTRPDKLEFLYGRNGKPAIAGQLNGNAVEFNLAHSEALAMLAVTRTGAVGIDLERIRTITDADELVGRFFSPRENDAFQKLPPEQKPAAFFNLWTRKEAWLKATGDGITHHLNRVEVTFLPGEPVRLLSLPDAFQSETKWSLHELTPAPGFAAALATAGEHPHISCWRWRSEDKALS
jgi:4'-phosphopantetheinyl transferase